MYPRVKVRQVEESEKDDEYVVPADRPALLCLKDFNSPTLQDNRLSHDKEYISGSPPSIARIPKFYVPSFTLPSISSSKGENNKETEDIRQNIRASSIPPPRAVLSSPDNDGIIGNRNQASGERNSIMKKSNLGAHTASQGKVNTRSVTAKVPVHMRRLCRETSSKKSDLKGKENPELTVPKQSPYLRKGKQRSTENLGSTILSHS
ncbi:hypothetical protein IFM89_038610 [Coptis chinensis]|uniref:Uncharacterized protein n=1 Tax=Coptis chinensis TaxID=261450 RepID=A0A835I8N6_9MAGN|nr:hypothetical protein IFM89_038610 [Coptis chinensis]